MKGYDKLTVSQKELFEKTYKAHISTMDEKRRIQHSRDKIIEIKWDSEEERLEVYFKWNHPKKDYLKVYYDNGEWYHLAPGEMFKF